MTKKQQLAVEYAKSGRAACRQCARKIEQGHLRVGHTEAGAGGYPVTRWFHPQCYLETDSAGRHSLQDCSPEDLFQGFHSLKSADQAKITALLQEQQSRRASGSESKQEGITQGPEGGKRRGGTSEGEEVAKRARTLASSFQLDQALGDYRGIKLPAPWKSFQTVIFHPGSISMAPNPRIAAFDFDGCLAKTDVRVMGADAWSLMFPSVPDKLRHYHSEGFKLAIFTNEATIDRFSKARKKAIDSKLGRLNALLAMLDLPAQVFVACAASSASDAFRKPAPGMWRLLESLNDGVAVDMEQSFYVGDAAGRPKDHSDADIEFARAVGLRFMVPEEVFI